MLISDFQRQLWEKISAHLEIRARIRSGRMVVLQDEMILSPVSGVPLLTNKKALCFVSEIVSLEVTPILKSEKQK